MTLIETETTAEPAPVAEPSIPAPAPPPPTEDRGRGRGRRPLRPYQVPRPRAPRPQIRDGRWWLGVIWATTTAVIIGILLHLTLISGMQHARAQTLAFDELRTDLAKAEAPVAPLDNEGRPFAHGTPVGFITIPAIGLREVIIEGTDSDTMREGPGHRRDSVMPGQKGTSVVFGRQSTYGAPFARLGELEVGDEIVVWTGQGEQRFSVFGLRRDGDPLPPPLEPGAARLQLVTANGFALFPSGGLYLDAELVSDVQETPGRIMTEASLPDSEVALGFDVLRIGNLLVMLALLGVSIYGVVAVWRRTGRWQAWVIGVPVIVTVTLLTADSAASMLPNLI